LCEQILDKTLLFADDSQRRNSGAFDFQEHALQIRFPIGEIRDELIEFRPENLLLNFR